MQKNIDLVVNRGQRLDNLQDKTDNLAQSAQGFRRGANRVRKQMWWKDMKMRMCLILGVIILILIIVIPSTSQADTEFELSMAIAGLCANQVIVVVVTKTK